ncbi:SDR family oxidoreductase [Butyricicoccus faecihominis]|uniref:SDR family NAD(P)-dependent oxidoreductase n=2 Tax=Butyricicoccaceae TaxID=3085642 RepID=UPI0024792467|nr:SDR family NAD(P)-dependent oxidoreductase [Butyricicoccus faecihominis]MCQ5131269.1 SDR family oxidoreductase [Butyricicoccus faecihominis]
MMLNKGISLKDQVAVVTGGGAGIGRAICMALGAHGAKVLVADMALQNAEETASMICAAGGQATAVQVDVTNAADAQAMIDKAVRLFGRVDLLYNNAGICTVSEIEKMPEDWWDKIFAVNCKGVFLCSKAAIPQMKKQGGGRIINTASQAGKGAIPKQVHYCATKAAVIGYTRALAMELKDTGIRVNCFCPGSVMSDMTLREAQAVYELDGIEPEQSLKAWQADIPLGRWVTPEDVADIAVFLASDYAAYMTGQAVNISGGQTMN